MRFEAEYLDEGTGFFLEMEARLNDLCVVVDEKVAGGEEVGQVVEMVLVDVAVAVVQQLGMVARGDRVAGYAVVGQVVVEVGDVDILYVKIHCRRMCFGWVIGLSWKSGSLRRK